jgi:aminocarboxymuconate-semialdehyde decarboxylase
MISRRNFVKSAGTAVSFVACTCGGFAPMAAESSRRGRITIGGKTARVIDFHAHCIVPAVAAVIRNTPLDRQIPKSQIIADARIKAMDERGIDTQVLSINQFWWYDAELDLAKRIVETQDNGLAEICRTHEGRFVALSSPSLQFPELAATQVDHAVRNLGFNGVAVGGHVRGEVPTAERFDPFWHKVQELDVPVFIHPNSGENVIQDGAWKGRGDLGNIIGNPLETTVFLTKLIFEGVLDRFPRLRIVGAHGGGYLPSYIERTNVACQVRQGANCLNKRAPRDYFKDQILVDSMVFSQEGLRHLIAEVGAKQIVFGSDMPFTWPDTVDDVMKVAGLSEDERLGILGNNAAALLRMS